MNNVSFVGPLPLPLHGFSWVNGQVLSRLSEVSRTFVFDRAAPKSIFKYLGDFGVLLKAFFQLFCFFILVFSRKQHALYIGWSGGKGMVIDCCFVTIARLHGIPVYVHHHAFSYLNKPSLLSLMCMRVLKSCHNIVLCGNMGTILSRVYSIPLTQITVLSNSAFLSKDSESGVKKCGYLRIGFLSNITAEKGIFDFFDLAKRMLKQDGYIEFVIAGPVGFGIKSEFDQSLALLPNVTHIGPVYDQEKDAFFRSIDVLAFPTRYANEAEPVTIFEAFRAGVPVIANHRGCVDTILDDYSGLGIKQATDFVDQAEMIINKWLADPTELTCYRDGARARFEKMHAEYSLLLDSMILRIAKGLPLGDCT